MQVFALVDDGKIIEYPVYLVNIEARSHPVSLYTECVFSEKPETCEFHYLEEELDIVNGNIYVSYLTKPHSLANLLSRLPVAGAGPTNPDRPYESTYPFNAEVVERIKELTVIKVQQSLDDFSRTRGYDGILSACTYLGSSIDKFRLEAEYCRNIRDQTWLALYTLMAEVDAQLIPMPSTFEEIVVFLPEMVWPA